MQDETQRQTNQQLINNFKQKMKKSIQQKVKQEFKFGHNTDVIDLLAQYLYYDNYKSQQWEAKKLYLIYQKSLKILKTQYMDLLKKILGTKIQQDQQKYQEFQIALDDHFEEFQKSGFKKKDRYDQHKKVGITLQSRKNKNQFLMIQQNILGQYYFKILLNDSISEFNHKLDEFCEKIDVYMKKLKNFYENKESSKLLQEIQVNFQNFKKRMVSFREFYQHTKENQQINQKQKAENFIKKWTNSDSTQLRKNISHKRYLNEDFQSLRKMFCGLFYFHFCLLQEEVKLTLRSRIYRPQYSFPKGSKIWFQDAPKACKRECFQQTLQDISQLQLKRPSFECKQQQKSQIYYYFAKKDPSDSTLKRKLINSYQTISSEWKKISFEKPRLMARKQLKLQKNEKKDMETRLGFNISKNAYQAIEELKRLDRN